MKNAYKELLDKVYKGSQCVMLTWLELKGREKGSVLKKALLEREDIEKRICPLQDGTYEEIMLSLETGKLGTVSIEDNMRLVIEPLIPEPRLIVFGGGHIAKPLSEFAARVGFSVTVVDDRPFFANQERFPYAQRVICEDFQKSFELIDLRSTDFVVVITRGHRHDGVVLRRVLKHELSYVGMIGSRRRARGMMQALQEEGYSSEKLECVNSPIGVDIDAITPEEIAISITAQLISFKNRGRSGRFGKDFAFPEFDREVAERISEESEIPKALITILSSKGSVPRKAGAKMVAYYDGRTVGSIGGGCSEAGIITKARDVMLSKGFFIEHVDMMGDIAESEGMVCGGTMEVLVEAF